MTTSPQPRLFAPTLTWMLLAVLLCTAGCGDSTDDALGSVGAHACVGAVLSASPPGPAAPGTNVTLSASGVTCGPLETPQYMFLYKQDGTPGPYQLIRTWGPSPTASWDTSGRPSGKYSLIVHVRAAGATSSQSFAYGSYSLTDVCTAATLMTSPAPPQAPGTPVTLTGSASCTGGAPAEYRMFYRAPGSSAYTAIGPYSASPSLAWDTTGLPGGTYGLLLYVRRLGNTSTFEALAYGSYSLGSTCSSVLLSAAPPSPRPVGTSVSLSASANCAGGVTPEYRFFYRAAGSSVLTEIQPYSTSSTATWSTGALSPTSWVLRVHVRAAGTTSVADATHEIGYVLSADLQVVAGASHTCVRVNGGVKCFGRTLLGGSTGQYSLDRGLDAADLGDALPAVDVGTGRSVLKFARGAYHTCALLDGGAVKCWGANGGGALGLGDRAHRSAGGELGDALPAVALGTGRFATEITAGAGFTCVILDDGSVKCWGSNSLGQLGQGDTANRGDDPGEMGDALPPINLGTGRTAKSLASGVAHTCAILDDDSLKCWGFNSFGVLGLGDGFGRGDAPGEMGDALPTVSLGTGRTAQTIGLGAYQTCAILDDGNLKCWGYNAWGQLGQGDTANRADGPGEMGDNLLPVNLGTGRRAVALGSGGHHTCALLDDSTVKCWGSNATGLLGLGDTNHRGDAPGEMGDALQRVLLGTGRTVRRLTATYLNTCAELDDGTVKCWGGSANATLGIGPSDTRGDDASDMGDNLPAFMLGSGRSIASFGSGFGYHFACALLDDARLKCWGANSYGQLGIDGSSNVGDEPADMGTALEYASLGAGATVTSVGAGSHHTCALLADGRVKCWGANRFGTLGYGDEMRRDGRPSYMGDNLPAVDLGAGRTATGLAVGSDHTCALLDDGTVKCWGAGDLGQLGQGDAANRGDDPGEMGDALPPVQLGTGRTALSLVAGYGHTCALLDDLSLKCWGFNLYGMLGLANGQNRGDGPGEMGDALAAVNLGTGRRAVSVAAGVYNTCALLDDASVKCWGANAYGQLGQGDTLYRGHLPGSMGDALPTINLGTGLTAKSLHVGQQHVCAILTNDRVKCWGANQEGKLGLGDLLHRGDQPGEMGDALPFVDFGATQTAVSMAAGSNHNCAALTSGSLKCWGTNNGGELGYGDERSRGALLSDMGATLPAVSLGPL